MKRIYGIIVIILLLSVVNALAGEKEDLQKDIQILSLTAQNMQLQSALIEKQFPEVKGALEKAQRRYQDIEAADKAAKK